MKEPIIPDLKTMLKYMFDIFMIYLGTAIFTAAAFVIGGAMVYLLAPLVKMLMALI